MNEWFKSSFSSAGDNCVEVRFAEDGVAVRNSKSPLAGAVDFTYDEWSAFLAGVRNGEFDRS